jgi:antitoxin HicB
MARPQVDQNNPALLPKPPALGRAGRGYSGKWRPRARRSLHRRLAERRKREGVSLDTLAVTLLAEGLGERAAHGD